MIKHDKCQAYEEKIQELEAKLKIAVEVLDYYSRDIEKWIAREALLKIKEKDK